MRMAIEVIAGMAGDAGVRRRPCPADDGVATGKASQSNRGDGAGVAGGARVVVFRTGRVDQERREVTNLDTAGVAATDKGAVVGDMGCCSVGMAVKTGEGDGGVVACLGDGVGHGPVNGVVGSGRIVAGAAAVAAMSGLDVIPGFNLPGVAIETAAAFPCREVGCRIVAQPVGVCR